MSYLGIDIGGTKCAVIRGHGTAIEDKRRFATTAFAETLQAILSAARELFTPEVTAIGVSCGGPLDSERGIIQSPPNLPGWDDVPITAILQETFGVPAYLCNDANACALAEWRYGAGVGTRNMIFLTFGTGMGSGLILDGKLYAGASGMAGEVGHVTLHPQGDHEGYNKRGTVEGYCSGGGIAQYGKGTARELGQRAEAGDAEAVAVYRQVGADLGRALAILVDLFNPEAIVIGSIYARSEALIAPSMWETLKQEALPASVAVCRVLPAILGESIGDVAALCVAEMGGE